MSVWPTIERFITEHGAAALVTLAETRGSSPREPGARMVVRPDGGFTGTIGGGALEWMALAEAQSLLAQPLSAQPTERRLRRLDKALGPELGQCCGGRVIVTVERFDAGDAAMVGALAAAERKGPLLTVATSDGTRLRRRPIAPGDAGAEGRAAYRRLPDGNIIERFGLEATPLYLFGAGHVGRSLVQALAPLAFAVTWVDPRPGAFPSQVPENVTPLADAEPVRLIDRAPDGACVAIMTHSHGLDLDLAMAALKAERFGYVGLIGSATKRARFTTAMCKIGMPPHAVDRLICPIGLTDIRDKAPAAIAASIAAQLLIVRDRAAASAGHGRGGAPAPSVADSARHA